MSWQYGEGGPLRGRSLRLSSHDESFLKTFCCFLSGVLRITSFCYALPAMIDISETGSEKKSFLPQVVLSGILTAAMEKQHRSLPLFFRTNCNTKRSFFPTDQYLPQELPTLYIFIKDVVPSWPMILALRRLRQEDCNEFKVNLAK